MCISSDYGLTALLGAIGAPFGPLWAHLEATEKENGIFSADFYPIYTQNNLNAPKIICSSTNHKHTV